MATLGLTGHETFDFTGLATITQGQKVTVKVKSDQGATREFTVLSRIDTPNEVEYFRHGGILPYVLRQQITK